MERVLEIEGIVETFCVKNPQARVPWLVKYVVDEKLQLPYLIQERMKVAIKVWEERFPKEPTFASIVGTPSLIVRVDGTIWNGELFIYEIEDSPSGIGLACKIVPGFMERLLALEWPSYTIVIDRKTKGGDDILWTYVIEKEDDLRSFPESYLLAPRVPSIRRIEGSIWPVVYRETKTYGTNWLWYEVMMEDIDSVVNEAANKKKWKGIVFKTDGARSERVGILIFSEEKKKVNEWLGNKRVHWGTCTLKKIKEQIYVQQWKKIYIQQFVQPLRIKFNGKNFFAIYRMFFGYHINLKEWRALGGFLNLRQSVLIHGTNDAILIPVEPTFQ